MWAQGAQSTAVREFPEYKLIDGNLDTDGLPTSGAKLCVIGPSAPCFQMPSNAGYSGGGVTYDYGLDPHAERLAVSGGRAFVLFSATFSGGGSGTLDSLSILRYEAGGKIVNLLPFVGLTNQGEKAVWSIPGVSGFPILVTADADWDIPKETHFARHFFEVSAYRFDPHQGVYARVLRYRTSKKYKSLDETDDIRVIEPERQEIMRRLTTATR
jgi:hypothetical protein